MTLYWRGFGATTISIKKREKRILVAACSLSLCVFLLKASMESASWMYPAVLHTWKSMSKLSCRNVFIPAWLTSETLIRFTKVFVCFGWNVAWIILWVSVCSVLVVICQRSLTKQSHVLKFHKCLYCVCFCEYMFHINMKSAVCVIYKSILYIADYFFSKLISLSGFAVL